MNHGWRKKVSTLGFLVVLFVGATACDEAPPAYRAPGAGKAPLENNRLRKRTEGIQEKVTLAMVEAERLEGAKGEYIAKLEACEDDQQQRAERIEELNKEVAQARSRGRKLRGALIRLKKEQSRLRYIEGQMVGHLQRDFPIIQERKSQLDRIRRKLTSGNGMNACRMLMVLGQRLRIDLTSTPSDGFVHGYLAAILNHVNILYKECGG